MSKTEVIIKGIEKNSLNVIYAGRHWTKRKKDKDKCKLIVRSQFKKWFSKQNQYKVSYTFFFKTKPLDASNTVYMLKMIEDVIFESDGYNVVTEIKIKSKKATEDYVKITVKELKK